MQRFEGVEVEQAICTWADKNMETGGAGVYAVSAGLGQPSAERLRDLRSAGHYDLPPGIRRNTRPQDMPVSLALLTLGDERLLVRRIYAGLDGLGRPSRHFAHLLLGLPASFTPRDAVGLWDSPSWLTQLGGLKAGSTLPSLALDQFTPGPLRRLPILAPSTREALAFLIAAYLGKQPGQPLVIVGLPETVVMFILALLEALPPALTRELTFSTYEANVTRAGLDVMGTCPAPLIAGEPPDLHLNLPANAYVVDTLEHELCVATELPDELKEYAAFAGECLTSQQRRTELDDFLRMVAAWQAGHWQCATPADLIVAWREYREVASIETFDDDYMLQSLRLPWALTRLSSSRLREAILAKVTAEPRWWRDRAERQYLDLLKESPAGVEAASGLASGAEAMMLDAAFAGDTGRLNTLLRIASLPDGSGYAPVHRLLAGIETRSRVARLNPATRAWAIAAGRYLGADAAGAIAAFVPRTLDELVEFLCFEDAPAATREATLVEAWRRVEFLATHEIETVLDQMPELVLQAMQTRLSEPDAELDYQRFLSVLTETQAIELFTGLVESSLVSDEIKHDLAQKLYGWWSSRPADCYGFLFKHPMLVRALKGRVELEMILWGYCDQRLVRPPSDDGSWAGFTQRLLEAIEQAPNLPADLRIRAGALRHFSWGLDYIPGDYDTLMQQIGHLSPAQKLDVALRLPALVKRGGVRNVLKDLSRSLAAGLGKDRTQLEVELLAAYIDLPGPVDQREVVVTLADLSGQPEADLKRVAEWEALVPRLERVLTDGNLLETLVVQWGATRERGLWRLFVHLLTRYADKDPRVAPATESALQRILTSGPEWSEYGGAARKQFNRLRLGGGEDIAGRYRTFPRGGRL